MAQALLTESAQAVLANGVRKGSEQHLFYMFMNEQTRPQSYFDHQRNEKEVAMDSHETC